MAHREKVKNFVIKDDPHRPYPNDKTIDVTKTLNNAGIFVDVKADGTLVTTVKAENFTVRCNTVPPFIPALRLDSNTGDMKTAVRFEGKFIDLDTLIAAARLLCDNVQTVGTHNRVETDHLEALRKALDGL